MRHRRRHVPAGRFRTYRPSGEYCRCATWDLITRGGQLAKPAFTNVRVNNPSLDTHEPDQTTQSETTIAVAGSHVAVGYNDSQQTGPFLTAGSDLTGYSYSADGGAHFTDGGSLPNTPEFVNFGDPWLASTRAGDMYFSNLALDFVNGNLDVAVAKSTDGGKTWGTPVPVFRPPFSIFYSGDKPALATGPDPAVTSRDDIGAPLLPNVELAGLVQSTWKSHSSNWSLVQLPPLAASQDMKYGLGAPLGGLNPSAPPWVLLGSRLAYCEPRVNDTVLACWPASICARSYAVTVTPVNDAPLRKLLLVS